MGEVIIKERGKWVDITLTDTDFLVFSVPKNEIGLLKNIEVRNPTPGTARVRIWDQFVVDTVTTRIVKADYRVPSASQQKFTDIVGKHVIGDVIVQSTVSGLQVFVGAKFR